MRMRSVVASLVLLASVNACEKGGTGPRSLEDGELGLAVSGSAVSFSVGQPGRTVAYGLTRTGSAGVVAGGCGTRLQCFKTAITEADAATAQTVENAALVLLDAYTPDQDVNLKVSGKQLLIAPTADPNLNGKPDIVDAVNKVSLGGGTCITCALQAAQSAFTAAPATSAKVIVLLSERPNGFPPANHALLSDMVFDANTEIHAFAVGPAVTCASDPFHLGSLNDAAALTPRGSCTNVASFDGLGALVTEAVNGGGEPEEPTPDVTSPQVTLTTPADDGSAPLVPTFAGGAGTEAGDDPLVTVKVWLGSDAAVAPILTLSATRTGGTYSVQATQSLTEGVYIARAEQQDAAGNLGQTAFIAFTVTAPPPPPPPPSGLATVAWAFSRSGSAGSAGGACGSRLQCFKTAITEASASTLALVDKAAVVIINVAEPEQDVNLLVGGKQLLIAPDSDPSGNGKPDLIDAVERISLGGGTCYACALQAAEWSFESATPGTRRVIILITERVNVFRSTGFTSGGIPTGYPPMELAAMTFSDPNTVVHAFAVGSGVRCDSDPNGIGSLSTAAALTPGGSCTNVDNFDGLGAIIAGAVSR